MHARSENLHDCARSAPEICAIFEKRTLRFSYFQKPKIYIWEIRGSQNLKNPATRKKWPRHRIPEWWSSKRATAPALYHIVPSLRIVPHECQHARDPTDGGIATLNTPGPVSFSVKPISDACAPQ